VREITGNTSKDGTIRESYRGTCHTHSHEYPGEYFLPAEQKELVVVDQPEVWVGRRPQILSGPNHLVADTPATEAAEGGNILAGIPLRAAASGRGGGENGQGLLSQQQLSLGRLLVSTAIRSRFPTLALSSFKSHHLVLSAMSSKTM